MMSIITKMDKRIKIHTCRICLNTKCADIVLLEDENGWLRLFELCFGFTLTTEDEPRLLCKTCAEKVQSYVEFKEICQKSHNLWKSVISDVKCSVVKHNVENTNQCVKDPIAIKDESFDASLDIDLNFSNQDETVDLTPADVKIEIDVEDETVDLTPADVKIEIDKEHETVDLSSADVKIEINEEDMELKNEERLQKINKKDDPVRIQVDSKQNNCKMVVNHDDSGKCKKVYNCVNCKIKMHASKRYYLEHLKKCQVPKKQKRLIFDQEHAYDCGLCKLSFTSTKEMYSHLNDHWSNNDLACKLCDFVGVDLAAIASHRYTHVVPRDTLRYKTYKCHICKKTKQSLLALDFHYRKEHLKKAGGYCLRCNKEYTTLRYWKRHEATHGTPKHICDICGRGFYFKHAIRAHIMNHMRLNNCICDICGKTFARRWYLKLHKETVHCKSGPFKCTHCNRLFKNECTLSVHQKIIAREKTVKCEVCHKSFVTPNVLKLHMVTHSEERPHHCNICNRNYKHKSHLTVHLLRHTGLSRHKCLICAKTFTTARSLKKHSSVHTEVRKYSCSVSSCARTFQSKKLMLAHEVSHKGQNAGEK